MFGFSGVNSISPVDVRFWFEVFFHVPLNIIFIEASLFVDFLKGHSVSPAAQMIHSCESFLGSGFFVKVSGALDFLFN